MATAKNSVVSKIVKHYIKYDRDNPFIFISAVMAILGIAAGVMVMMVAIGITNGIQKHFKESLFVMNYPLSVVSYTDGIEKNIATKIQEKFPELKLSPYYTTQVISKSEYGIQGSMVYGVDFEKEAAINSVFADRSHTSSSGTKFKIVVGDSLSADMGVGLKEKMLLYFSEQQAVGFGSMPLQKRFVVDGIFDSGIHSYDAGIMYTTQKALQVLLDKDPDKFDGIHIYAEDPIKMAPKLQAMLPKDLIVEGWWQKNGNLFSAMEMEKKVYFLILLFIILIASLNIISSLLMTVMSRRSEIALLKTLGVTQKEIQAIFNRLGLIIGSIGILLGATLGAIGMWALRTFDIISLPEDVYGSSKLPMDLPLQDFGFIILGASIIVILSAIYPAKKASSSDPLKILRNE